MTPPGVPGDRCRRLERHPAPSQPDRGTNVTAPALAGAGPAENFLTAISAAAPQIRRLGPILKPFHPGRPIYYAQLLVPAQCPAASRPAPFSKSSRTTPGGCSNPSPPPKATGIRKPPPCAGSPAALFVVELEPVETSPLRRESGLITLIERRSAITIEPFDYGAIRSERAAAAPTRPQPGRPAPAPTLLKQRLKQAGQQWILGSWHNRLELPAPPPCSPANGYERQRPCSAPPKGSCRSISAGRTGVPGRRNPRPFQPGAAGRNRPQLRPPPAPAGRTPGTGQRRFPAAPLRRPALEQQLSQRPGRPASLPGTAEPPLRPRNNPPLRQPVAAAIAGPAPPSPLDSRPEPGAANRRRRSRNGSQLCHCPSPPAGKGHGGPLARKLRSPALQKEFLEQLQPRRRAAAQNPAGYLGRRDRPRSTSTAGAFARMRS